jgi:hypothetical protein
MVQTNLPTDAAPQPPDLEESRQRMTKAILRRKALQGMVTAIGIDITNLPRTDTLVHRSIKVLEYMRGYIKAVEDEVQEATDQYENAIYAARVQHDAAFKNERKSSLARVRREPRTAEPVK